MTMRTVIESYVLNNSPKILEIGAYDRPTFTKAEANIFFLDALSTEELAADAEKSPSYKKEDIVPVDYIIKSNEYERYINDTFDMILADNVFEHISNPIRWLMSLEKLLNPNGYIFLCIPEYDQIFDRFRNTTDLGHLIADYFEGVPDLDPRHTVELELFYDMNYVNKPNILEDRLSIKRLLEVYKKPHFGMHCHAFSSRTFEYQIIKPILKLGLMELSFVGLHPIYMSFVAVLQKHHAEIKLEYNQILPNPPVEQVPAQNEIPQDNENHNMSLFKRILRRITS